MVIGTRGELRRHCYHFSTMLHWLRLHPRRLLSAPRVEVTSVAAGAAQVTVHGLVCGVCALRTRAALESVAGVREACVDLDAGTATLALASGATLDASSVRAMQRDMQRALDRVVVAMPVRRAIQRTADALRAMGSRRAEGRRA